MSNQNDITIRPEEVERFNATAELKVGDWYWVTFRQEDYSHKIDSFLEHTYSINHPDDKRLMCLTRLGSTQARLTLWF